MSNSATTPPFILVDGSSYLFRAFHALPNLTNAEGLPTGAIYGVINMLRRLINDYAPARMAVVFDTKGKNFRHALYPDYKANRGEMPAELAVQIQPLHEIIQAMGLPLVAVDGVEADDVIGTLAKAAAAQGMSTVISTGDKDMAQLVNEHVSLINTMTDTLLDTQGVIDKFGVHPERIIDYLCLMGDTSDNIPGVSKVGPKTAVKWLDAYGSLDGIIAHAEDIKGKVGDNLRAHLAQFPLGRQLVTIRCDVALPVAPDQLICSPADEKLLAAHFKTMGFKSWLKALGQTDQQPLQYETVTDEHALDRWVAKLQRAKYFAFDTETTSLNYMQATLVGISVAVEKGAAAYIPIGHDYEGAPQQLSRDVVLAKLTPLLENPNLKKIGQHIKYDRNVLAQAGITLKGIAFDTMLESYVNNSVAHRHDLDTLALTYLDHETTSFEAVAGTGAKQITFNQVPLEQAAPYACEDADITLQLHEELWPKLAEQQALKQIFTDIEMPLVEVLSDMECTGVLLDKSKLDAQSDALAQRLDALEAEAVALAGESFNLGSPKQLQHILFEKHQLPVLQKTPKGAPSTAESVLQELAHNFPLPKLILEYRSLSKLKSTYTDKLPEQINANTQRVHTSYHQAVTATGRLSSASPNLQNIPIRTPEGRRVRQAFIAPPGHKLVAADYSQIELRIMAHLSEDEGLLNAFHQGLDIHKATAAEVFGGRIDSVTLEQRRRAKAINFGLIYGMSAFGLSKQLGIERQEAQAYIDSYFARYPGVHNYMERTREQAHRDGYVETLLGRRLYLPEINARQKQRQLAAERTAINAPLQGTAADIIKLAMIHVHQWLKEQEQGARLIMQVHDELVLEVKAAHVEKVISMVKEKMSGAMTLKVPLIVDVGIGEHWDEAH